MPRWFSSLWSCKWGEGKRMGSGFLLGRGCSGSDVYCSYCTKLDNDCICNNCYCHRWDIFLISNWDKYSSFSCEQNSNHIQVWEWLIYTGCGQTGTAVYREAPNRPILTPQLVSIRSKIGTRICRRPRANFEMKCLISFIPKICPILKILRARIF